MERIYLEISHSAGSQNYHVRGLWSGTEFPGTQFKARDLACNSAAWPLDEQALHELTSSLVAEIKGWSARQEPLF